MRKYFFFLDSGGNILDQAEHTKHLLIGNTLGNTADDTTDSEPG